VLLLLLLLGGRSEGRAPLLMPTVGGTKGGAVTSVLCEIGMLHAWGSADLNSCINPPVARLKPPGICCLFVVPLQKNSAVVQQTLCEGGVEVVGMPEIAPSSERGTPQLQIIHSRQQRLRDGIIQHVARMPGHYGAPQ